MSERESPWKSRGPKRPPQGDRPQREVREPREHRPPVHREEAAPSEEHQHAREHRETELRLYGVNAVKAAFHRRPEALRKLYLVQDRIPQLQPMLRWCVAHRIGYRVVEDEDDLRRLASSEHHEGVVADMLREPQQSLTSWLQHLPAGPVCALWLDGVGNPHNVGAILRSAAHFGVSAILLAEAFQFRVVRRSGARGRGWRRSGAVRAPGPR